MVNKMGLIIISIILCIATIIGVLVMADNKVWCLSGLLWLLIILLGCFTTVGANAVGIFYNPLKRRDTR